MAVRLCVQNELRTYVLDGWLLRRRRRLDCDHCQFALDGVAWTPVLPEELLRKCCMKMVFLARYKESIWHHVLPCVI